MNWQTLLVSSVLAALITALNAHLLTRYNRRIMDRIEDWKGSIGDRSFFLEQSYEREYEIYRELWPAVHEICTTVQMGDVAINRSKHINLTKEQLEERAKRLSDRIKEAVVRIERIRPFVPAEVYALITEFTMLAVWKRIEWKDHDLSNVTPEGEARTEEIRAKTEEILELLRKRLTWQGYAGAFASAQ